MTDWMACESRIADATAWLPAAARPDPTTRVPQVPAWSTSLAPGQAGGRAANALAGPARETTSDAPWQLLLAEDHEVNVYLFEAMLEGLPLHISVAHDGLEALEMVRTQHYDIAFFDVQMPGMDGLTLTRELRQIEARNRRARMPVVALTANAFASDVELSLQAGCDLHVAKPFDKARLLEALSSLLQRSSAG